MNKSIRFSDNSQLEAAGFIAVAALTIPTIVFAAYVIAKLVVLLF